MSFRVDGLAVRHFAQRLLVQPVHQRFVRGQLARRLHVLVRRGLHGHVLQHAGQPVHIESVPEQRHLHDDRSQRVHVQVSLSLQWYVLLPVHVLVQRRLLFQWRHLLRDVTRRTSLLLSTVLQWNTVSIPDRLVLHQQQPVLEQRPVHIQSAGVLFVQLLVCARLHGSSLRDIDRQVRLESVR